ncbi:KamA family radical SAM protein [Treponema sp. OttesenSCG-928-L16]|nr:KamA family radical SAM protein [Treponema sp. OttesenSCG-928-L16]
MTFPEELPPALAGPLRSEEKAYIEKLKKQGCLPFGVTPFFASLAEGVPEDPIRRQFFPDPREEEIRPYELADPLGEAQYRHGPRLVHQYRDRVLLLSNGACAGYCRHCFRRVWMGKREGFITAGELEEVLAYLREHREVREILVSGGDPLSASDEKLVWLLGSLRRVRPELLLRICTRVPVTDPRRIDGGLLDILRNFRPLRFVVHINHPRELAPEVRTVLSSGADAGLPVHIQTVLLKGINDDAEILARLFRECLNLGATPYYLFQGDLAPGTGHFRTGLKEGLEIFRQLRSRVSSLALPVYAVDLPGGGGKIPLHDESIAGEKEDKSGQRFYLLRDADGRLWEYPAEE